MKKIKEKAIFFKNQKGEKLCGVLTLPTVGEKVRVVILVHGFYGSKSHRKFVKLSREFAKERIAVLRFDFSGCGESEGDFENMSITQEVGDLDSALKFLLKQPQIDKKKVGLFGYSLGGLIACFYQKNNPIAKALVLVAPALNQKSLIKIWYTPKQLKEWRKKKYFDTPKCRIGISYLNETKDYTTLLSTIKIPTLIIHGRKDNDVPLKYSEKLFLFLKGIKKMTIVENTDHDFESYHSLRKLINLSLNWFKKYL